MQNLSQSTLFTTLLLLVNTSVFAAKTDRPNILLIMADDQGYGDTGFTGHPTLKTPHMDSIAANGIVFDRFYASAPVCSPYPLFSKTKIAGT